MFYVRGKVDDQGIYLGSLGSTNSTRLTAADSAGAYMPPGWLIFIRNDRLVARAFNASRGELSGEPVVVADRVGFEPNVSVGAFSISAAGALIYKATLGRREARLTSSDRSGKPIGTHGAPDPWVAFQRSRQTVVGSRFRVGWAATLLISMSSTPYETHA